MKKGCVILAAGRNSRLDTGKPKSLLKIKDQSLLERHIDLFSKAGVTHFCIITGYQSEKMEEEVQRVRSLFEAEISTVYNSRFDLENGYSVWSAKSWLQEHRLEAFYLTMADHVFDPQFILDFVSIKVRLEASLYLAVDRPGPGNQHIDLEDVTKVQADNGNIVAIGKELSSYNFFDTGLFFMQSGVMKAFEESFKGGRYSISNTVTSLAKKGDAKIIDMTGHVWNDVDNPDDYKKSKGLDLS